MAVLSIRCHTWRRPREKQCPREDIFWKKFHFFPLTVLYRLKLREIFRFPFDTKQILFCLRKIVYWAKETSSDWPTCISLWWQKTRPQKIADSAELTQVATPLRTRWRNAIRFRMCVHCWPLLARTWSRSVWLRRVIRPCSMRWYTRWQIVLVWRAEM